MSLQIANTIAARLPKRNLPEEQQTTFARPLCRSWERQPRKRGLSQAHRPRICIFC